MPVHNRCNEIKNISFFSMRMQQRRRHRRHTAVAQGRHVPRPCPRTTGVMKSRTDHFSAVTHAAEATTQETHCCCTRHVPRRVPRPCPCTTGVMKSRTCHFSAVTHAAEATTQETQCCCTRHVPRRVPRPCPCTTGVIKSRIDHLSALTHAAEATAHKTHYCCTRHVPRRVPRPCWCTADFNKIRYINRKFISILTRNKGHDIGGVHSACTEARASSMPVHKRL